MAGAQQSFGEQAARFSLYVPLTVAAIGLFTAGSRDQPVILYGVPILNVTLIAVGLVLGIVALFSMKRFGKERILGRAITGIILNGTALVAVTILLVPLILVGQIKGKVLGHWRLTHSTAAANNGPIEINFGAEGAFGMDGNAPNVGPLKIVGTWSINRSREIGVRFISVNGHPPGPSAAKPIGLGVVRSVTADHLRLSSDNGVEEYDRIP